MGSARDGGHEQQKILGMEVPFPRSLLRSTLWIWVGSHRDLVML